MAGIAFKSREGKREHTGLHPKIRAIVPRFKRPERLKLVSEWALKRFQLLFGLDFMAQTRPEEIHGFGRAEPNCVH